VRERWIAEFQDFRENGRADCYKSAGRFHVLVYRSTTPFRPWRARIVGTDALLVILAADAEAAKSKAEKFFTRQCADWQKVDPLQRGEESNL
jgi:hypothetical protein